MIDIIITYKLSVLLNGFVITEIREAYRGV